MESSATADRLSGWGIAVVALAALTVAALLLGVRAHAGTATSKADDGVRYGDARAMAVAAGCLATFLPSEPEPPAALDGQCAVDGQAVDLRVFATDTEAFAWQDGIRTAELATGTRSYFCLGNGWVARTHDADTEDAICRPLSGAARTPRV